MLLCRYGGVREEMPFVVLLIGLLLVLFEFFSSGGFFALVGSVAIIASVIWSGFYTGSALPTIVFGLIAALSTYGVYRFGTYYIKRRMRPEEDESHAIGEVLIGEIGHALESMRPSGQVEIKGTHHLALSEKGYIKEGEKVEVIRFQLGQLIVRKV